MNLTCDKKGITMIEVLVSAVLVSFGVLALLTLLPSGWRLSGTSDLLGRATGILQAELEREEISIMNGNNVITATASPEPRDNPPRTVYASGQQVPGDLPFQVWTARVDQGGSWLVRVQVTWPGKDQGIRESVVVTRQKYFLQ